MIPIRREWTSQPPAGTPLRKDGLARGIIFCQAGSTAVDLASGAQGAVVGTGVTRSVSRHGPEFKTSANGTDRIDYAHTGVPKSYAAVFKADSFPNSGGYLAYRSLAGIDGADVNNVFWMSNATSALGQLQITFFGGRLRGSTPLAGRGWTIGSASMPPDLRTYTQGRIYIDGKLETPVDSLDGTAPTSNYGAANKISTMSRRDVARNWVGDAPLIVAWDRVITDAEHVAFAANPWQIYEPQTLWVPVSAGGAPSHTPSPVTATLTPSSVAPAALQRHQPQSVVAVLAPASVSQVAVQRHRPVAVTATLAPSSNAPNLAQRHAPLPVVTALVPVSVSPPVLQRQKPQAVIATLTPSNSAPNVSQGGRQSPSAVTAVLLPASSASAISQHQQLQAVSASLMPVSASGAVIQRHATAPVIVALAPTSVAPAAGQGGRQNPTAATAVLTPVSVAMAVLQRQQPQAVITSLTPVSVVDVATRIPARWRTRMTQSRLRSPSVSPALHAQPVAIKHKTQVLS